MRYLLKGELAEGVLPNLLQYLAQSSVSGCLELRHPDGFQAYLFFMSGALHHISLGRAGPGRLQRDVAALAVLLGWQKGRFQFREGVKSPIQTIEKPLENVLLEAARLADEEAHATGELIHAGSVLRAKPPASGEGQVMMSVAGLQLLSAFNGVDSLAEIAARWGTPPASLITAAQELFLQNLAEPSVAIIAPELIGDLKRFLVQLVGPVGQIIVEDSLQELNLTEEAVPQRALAELAGVLRGELQRPAWRAAFERHFRQLCQHYEVSL